MILKYAIWPARLLRLNSKMSQQSEIRSYHFFFINFEAWSCIIKVYSCTNKKDTWKQVSFSVLAERKGFEPLKPC